MSESPLTPDLPTAPPESPGAGSGLGRLFLVPLLIVAAMVGCSALVVLMFGWIGTGKQQRLETLIAQIEQSEGYRNPVGGMWPKEKEVWQAAQELAVRLENKDSEIPLDRQPELARRLAASLQKTCALDPQALTLSQRKSLSLRERYLTRALGLLALPECVPPLVDVLAAEPPPGETARNHALVRKQYAAEALALMPGVEGIAAAIPELCRTVSERDLPVPPRLVCVVALSILAEPGHPQAVATLESAYLESDREMKWNAALALARLGSTKPRPLLREMLSRDYWAADDLVRMTAPDGSTYRNALTPIQIDGYLSASIQAVRALGDPALNGLADRLIDDPSPKVREAALKHAETSTVHAEESD